MKVLYILNYCLDLFIDNNQTPKKMENLITKNQEYFSTVETKHLQVLYDFVNEQLIIDQFRRHLDSIKRSEYQEYWFDIQMILQQRNNLTK